MLGENFVSLTGKLQNKKLKQVGMNNNSLLNATIAIPTQKGTNQYIKVAAWGSSAEALAELHKDSFIY
jgi:hypothetical protein